MEGSFSFADSLIGTGTIDESDLDALSFSVLLNGVSQGTTTFPSPGSVSALNFNFDTSTETFVIGGFSSGPGGQKWNYLGAPVGFVSGSGSQWASVGSQEFGGISVHVSTLTAYRISPIPVPASLPLLVAGLGGLAIVSCRRKRAD